MNIVNIIVSWSSSKTILIKYFISPCPGLSWKVGGGEVGHAKKKNTVKQKSKKEKNYVDKKNEAWEPK